MSSRRDYFPTTDSGVEQFTANFSGLISIDPAVYGLDSKIAADYSGLQKDFAAKLTAAVNPATRGRLSVFQKDEARKALVLITRKYAQQISKMVSVTDDQRVELGITIADTKRTPVPAPTTSPHIKVIKTEGRYVTLELSQTKAKRGKPNKVAGATIFTFTGPVAPQGADGWKFIENTTKTTVQIPFPPSSTGDTIWITAFWSNSRDESGPAAAPISIALPAGGVLPKETSESMKLAA